MAASFVPIEDDVSFSIEGSNYSVVAKFSSDVSNVYIQTFANSNSNVGFLWGVSNITSSLPKLVIGKTQAGSPDTPANDFSLYEGNVGIGVTNVASYKLDVNGDVNFNGQLYNKGALLNIYGASSNIGIGTSTPQQPLDVVGAIRTTSQLISSVSTGTAPLQVASTTLVSNLNAEYLSGQSSNYYRNATNLNDGTLSSSLLPTSGVTSGTYGNASNLPQITVDTYGRVTSAINTQINVPVNNVVGICNVAKTADYNDLVNRTFVLSNTAAVYTSGNVGIGTTNPSFALHVVGNTQIDGTFRATTINADDITTGTLSSNILQAISGLSANTYGSASSVNTITVDTKGRITNISNQPISISRSAITDLVDPWSSNTSTAAVYYNSGNVGIGTTVANEKLHVNGAVQVGGYIYPTTCNTYDLGSSSAKFKNIYAEGTAYVGSISASNLAQSAFTDTTVATNITSGTLSASLLPTSGVSAGTYGTASNIPRITVDTYGRVTSVNSSSTINYNDLTNKTFVLNGTSAYYIGGNVGVGTSTPLAALSVGTGANDTSSVLLFNSSDTSSNTNKIIFTYVQDGSRIGHSAGWNINMYAGTSNVGTGGFHFFLPSGVVNGGYNERVTFAYNGNVGLGSTLPAFTLDVATGNGDINFNGSLYQNKTNTIINSSGILNSNVFPTISGLSAATYGSASAVPQVTVDTRGRITSISTAALSSVASTGDYNSLSNITFRLSGNLHATYTTSGGNVGIGTTTPEALLHVQGAASSNLLRITTGSNQGINVTTSSGANASGTPDYVYFGCKPAYSGGMSGGSFEPFMTLVNTSPRTYADVAFVQNGGNVGIGTTATSNCKLQVQGDLNVTGAIKQGGTEVVSNSGVINSNTFPTISGLTATSYGSSSSVATFSVDTKGRITSASTVAISGVPASSILSLCNVATTANYDDLSNQVVVRSGNNAYFSTTGNVGIGYPNPQYKLAVAGNFYCDATMYASNLTILGDFTTLNTVTSNTEQVVVTNAGTGPALSVRQTGVNPVAYFWDDSNIALTVADGGYVGIGTTNPGYMFEVNGGSANFRGSILQNGTVVASSGVLNSNVFPVTGVASGTYGNSSSIPNITIDQYGRITSASTVGPIDYTSLTSKPFVFNGTHVYYNSGNVGIGSSSPTTKLEVSGTVKATAFVGDGSGLTGVNSSQWTNSNVGASSNIYFGGGGYVGIGTTSPKYMLHVTEDVYANNVISYSDAKYKANVRTVENALDTINRLRGVTYQLTNTSKHPEKEYMGVIAQEIETYIPQVVYTDNTGMKSVSYGNMVGLFIEGFKDLTKIIKTQAQEIDALKLRLNISSTDSSAPSIQP